MRDHHCHVPGFPVGETMQLFQGLRKTACLPRVFLSGIHKAKIRITD